MMPMTKKDDVEIIAKIVRYLALTTDDRGNAMPVLTSPLSIRRDEEPKKHYLGIQGHFMCCAVRPVTQPDNIEGHFMYFAIRPTTHQNIDP